MRSNNKRINQTGLVSLMVTMILMMVISLIVLGFAQMSRREQRQAMDRQLSTQAFLAAETAINDAREAIRVGLRTTGVVPDKTECRSATGNDPYAGFNPVLDAANNVSYSCLLVNTRLQNIVQVIAADGNSATIPIHPVGGRIETLHLKWVLENTPSAIDMTRCSASVPAGGINSFPRSADWRCPYGVLRVDLVPTDSFNRDGLSNNQRAMFFYPTTGGTTQSLNYANARGAVMPMHCETDGCTVDVSQIIAGSNGATNFAMRIKGIYVGGSLDISADDSRGDPLLLKDAQALADATGKAQDVLRRVQVRIALQPMGNGGEYAIQSGSSICKRFGVSVDRFVIPDDMPGQDENNPMCQALIYKPVCTVRPTDIVMVLDRSGSMGSTFQQQSRMDKLKEVSNRFVANIGLGADLNHMGIVSFSSGPAQLDHQLAWDVPAIQGAVNSLNANGGTQYLTGLTLAENEFASPRARADVKKTVIFVSDGRPSDNEGQIMAATDRMKAAGIVVFTIGIELDSDGEQLMANMAGNGGMYVSADSEAELDRAINDITANFYCE